MSQTSRWSQRAVEVGRDGFHWLALLKEFFKIGLGGFPWRPRAADDAWVLRASSAVPPSDETTSPVAATAARPPPFQFPRACSLRINFSISPNQCNPADADATSRRTGCRTVAPPRSTAPTLPADCGPFARATRHSCRWHPASGDAGDRWRG